MNPSSDQKNGVYGVQRTNHKTTQNKNNHLLMNSKIQKVTPHFSKKLASNKH